MKLITIQSKKVLDILKSGKTYYANFDKIQYSNYKKQWKELAKYLGFKECPIFCSPIDDDTAITSSFIEIEGSKITLNVPDNECHIMDYYGFSDWLYYSSGQEYDDFFDWNEDKALKNIDAYLDKNANIVQVILNRIEPEWVDWSLTEATRRQLLDKSKNADITKSYGTTRYDRRNLQHVYNPKKNLDRLDMNALWKSEILSVLLDVHGETNNYKVEVLFDEALHDFASELKRNNYIFEYKVIYRALINAINRNDIYISCTCPDWYYTMSYQSTKGRYNAGNRQAIPARIRNPRDTKGSGCKHVMKVLADLSWALDLASCITNYVFIMEDKYPDKYKEIIFPVLYGMSYQKALDTGIIEIEDDEEKDLDELDIEEIDTNDQNTSDDESDNISNDEE